MWRLWAAVGERCGTIEHSMQSMLDRVDTGFNDLRANMLDLRQIVNEQLHSQDQHIDAGKTEIDELRKIVEPMRRGWDFRVALLRSSWKLTTVIVMVAGFVGGIFAELGLPWQWWP